MRKLKAKRANQDGLTPLGLPIGGSLTYIQLYRKLKKQRKMIKPYLFSEIYHRCHWGAAAPFVETFYPGQDGRKTRGMHWESGMRGPKKYEFTPMRQTMLLLMAAYGDQL